MSNPDTERTYNHVVPAHETPGHLYPKPGSSRAVHNAEKRTNQDSLMVFDPASGAREPYPSHAVQWREYNGEKAWLVNPWTGRNRDARDVGSDTFGHLIVPPGEHLRGESS